jgi:hypothetical protein
METNLSNSAEVSIFSLVDGMLTGTDLAAFLAIFAARFSVNARPVRFGCGAGRTQQIHG